MELTIDEITKDSVFIKYVNQNINELKANRRTRPEPKAGFRYTRDWYDRMNDKEIFNALFFISNYESIVYKKSNLSSEFRGVISYVCNKSLQQMIIEYNENK